MRETVQYWFNTCTIAPESEGFYPIEEEISEFLPSFDAGQSTEHENVLWTDNTCMAIWKIDDVSPHYIVWERMATVLGHAMNAPVAPVRLHSDEQGGLSSFSLVMASFNEATYLQSAYDLRSLLKNDVVAGDVLNNVFGSHREAYDQMARVMALDLLTQNADANWEKHTIWGKGRFYAFDYGLTEARTEPLELHAPLRQLGIEPDILAWMVPEIVKTTDWNFFDRDCDMLRDDFPQYKAFIDLMQGKIKERAALYAYAPPVIAEEFPSLEMARTSEDIADPQDRLSYFMLRPMRSAHQRRPAPKY